jgi:hypothetical protein
MPSNSQGDDNSNDPDHINVAVKKSIEEPINRAEDGAQNRTEYADYPSEYSSKHAHQNSKHTPDNGYTYR